MSPAAADAAGVPGEGYLVLDTDVFVWLTRGRGDEHARYVPLVQGKRIVLSFATVAELWRGAYLLNYGERRRGRLRSDLEAAVVVPPFDDLTHEWARLTVEARARGHPLGAPAQANDAWVAATARYYRVPLLTGNLRHFLALPRLILADG